MMPASAMNPIIDVAVNGAPNSQWPSRMPINVSGIGVRMTSGSWKAAELRHDQNIDAEDRHAEGRAHVAEGDVGDLPFAVPEQRRLRLRPSGWPCSRWRASAGCPNRARRSRRRPRACRRSALRSAPASSAITMSAKRPSRRKIGERAVSSLTLHDVAEFDDVASPGSALAGTGVDSAAPRPGETRFGSRTAISIGLRPSPRCE